MAEAPSVQTHKQWVHESLCYLVNKLSSGQQKKNCSTQSSLVRYRTNTMNSASFATAVASPNSELRFYFALQQKWFVSECRLGVLGCATWWCCL